MSAPSVASRVPAGRTGLWKTGSDQLRVHKPCGEKLVQFAPEGQSVTLKPSEELKREWRAKRDERDARTFWEEKFQKARVAAEARAQAGK